MSYFHLGAEAEVKRPSLTVRLFDGPVPGGTYFALCDGEGNQLPLQRDCEVDNPGFSKCGTVTATFHIDGDRVAFAK